jgi:23S rRNA (guanosine2251-2'-O)-methyltransferase
VLVIGSEGTGLRRLTREHCDALVGIEMPGGFESLNASVAAAIALYETARSRAQHAAHPSPNVS